MTNPGTSKATLQITTPSDRELAMTRVFDAPRRLVFDALTKPELVKRWLLGPPGWTMPVCEWSASPRLFVKRGAFALMACLALHDKAAPNKRFLALLPLIEKGARDERNFVKKGVNWALRAIGRRNLALNAAAVTVARRLAESPQAGERWVGKDALRELTSYAVVRRLAAKRSKERT